MKPYDYQQFDYDGRRIYLSSRYSRIGEMQGYKKQLESVSYKVVSRWVDGAHKGSKKNFAEYANEDLVDIEKADMMICFTEPEGSKPWRGGRHVEFGYAIALSNMHALHFKIYLVGQRENIFYHLPEVEQFETFEQLYKKLRTM